MCIAYVKLHIAYLRSAIYILLVVKRAIYILRGHGTQFAVLDKRRSVLRMSTDSVRIKEMVFWCPVTTVSHRILRSTGRTVGATLNH